MPSTARFNLAQRNTEGSITENIDDVYVSQYGRHDQLTLVALNPATIPWPTTGETKVYLIATVPGANGGDLTLTPIGGVGSMVVSLPPLGVKTPFLLPKQKDAVGVTAACTVPCELSMLFF